MKITIDNQVNAVVVNYNDVQGDSIFFKKRIICKSSVREVAIAKDSTYVEVVFLDGHKEQFKFDSFEGIADNDALFDTLAECLF